MADTSSPFGGKTPDSPSREETEHLVEEELGEGAPAASEYVTGEEAADQADTARKRL